MPLCFKPSAGFLDKDNKESSFLMLSKTLETFCSLVSKGLPSKSTTSFLSSHPRSVSEALVGESFLEIPCISTNFSPAFASLISFFTSSFFFWISKLPGKSFCFCTSALMLSAFSGYLESIQAESDLVVDISPLLKSLIT